MDVTHFALTWFGWSYGEILGRLGCRFDLYQSERKSKQLHKRRGQMDPSPPEFSTWVYFRVLLIWPGLNIGSVLYYKGICQHFPCEFKTIRNHIGASIPT